MNILDKLATIPGLEEAYLGVQPATPDGCITLFEYPATPPRHYFGGMGLVHNVQVRARDRTSAAAYARAQATANILARYSDGEIAVTQSTAILDIGVDDHDTPRHEYTVNFEVRRLN